MVTTRRMLAALIVGTAAIFAIRPDPREHWSVPPIVRVVSPGDLHVGDTDAPPRPRVLVALAGAAR